MVVDQDHRSVVGAEQIAHDLPGEPLRRVGDVEGEVGHFARREVHDRGDSLGLGIFLPAGRRPPDARTAVQCQVDDLAAAADPEALQDHDL